MTNNADSTNDGFYYRQYVRAYLHAKQYLEKRDLHRILPRARERTCATGKIRLCIASHASDSLAEYIKMLFASVQRARFAAPRSQCSA